MRFVYGLAFLVMASGAAWAQSEDSPKPKMPMVARAPELASWTIIITSANPQVAPSRLSIDFPQSIMVEKSGKIYREEVTFQSGKTSERWIYNGLELRTVPETGQVAFVPPQEDPAVGGFAFREADFEGLGWLALSNYQGVKKFEGKPAFLFEAREAEAKDSPVKWPVAYLSTESQLPIMTSDGMRVRTYRFNPPPPAPLVPPEKFLKVFQQLESDLNLVPAGKKAQR